MRFFLFCSLILLCGLSHFSIQATASKNTSWAENTLESMTQDEKIGQLFMIAAYVDPEYARKEIGNPHIIEEIDSFITQYHVGALAFVGPSEIAKQVALTNHYQKLSQYPLLIAQDLEWGLSMRLKDGMRFPKNITLGVVSDNQLLYEMGKEIARQARLIGVHMNLSPVLDVNIEPENIAINVRSFGSTPQLVALKGVAMLQGLQDGGVIASAKHFPGLGDITVDPHLGLPISLHSRKRLYEVELYPFAQAIQAGVLSIQTEHVVVPALGFDSTTPASLSPQIIDGLLKNEMGFTGLVLSGALRMKALTEHMSQEEIILKAFLAGSDMLLMPQDFLQAYQTLHRALKQGVITEQQVDARVLKILQMKEMVHLNQQSTVKIPTVEELETPAAVALKEKLYQNVVTVQRDAGHLVPLACYENNKIAYVQLGEASSTTFIDTLKKQQNVDSFFFPLEYSLESNDSALFEKIASYSSIILAVYPADPRRIEQMRLLNEKKLKEELKHFRVHGMSEALIRVAHALQKNKQKTIVTYFGSPFGFHFFDGYSTLIMAYENDPDAERAVAAILSGKQK